MERIQTDVVVIGSGPGGQKAAIQAAKLKKRVVVIERDFVPGGACLNSATIPSKSLREAIIDLTRFNERYFYGETLFTEITVNDLNYRLNRVLEDEREVIFKQLYRNQVRFIQGRARFEDPHTLAVVNDDFEFIYEIRSEIVIIATGSSPRNPIYVPFDSDVILDSTRLLSMDRIPKKMIVLGAGIVGSEYASFFSALGIEVLLLDKKERILPYLDAEIGSHLQRALCDIGLKFYGGKEPEEILRLKDRGVVRCKDGSSFDADVVLYALGREANVKGLHLENAGLILNPRGYLTVNEYFQTTKKNIYAVGDVIGYPALASTAMEQGRLATRHACGISTHPFPSFFPIGIYTIPEISYCGASEEELKIKNIPYEVGRAYYNEIGRSHITGSLQGLFKILFHKETLTILGVHIVGRNATELIHVGQIAMSFHAKLDYFADQVFNYPTFAEGYRIASLNGLNKLEI